MIRDWVMSLPPPSPWAAYAIIAATVVFVFTATLAAAMQCRWWGENALVTILCAAGGFVGGASASFTVAVVIYFIDKF
jgi:hypothetical protein